MQPLEEFARAHLATFEALAAQAGLFWPTGYRIEHTLRGRSVAGRAVVTKGAEAIILSPAYYVALGEAYRETIGHEFAHLVQVHEWRLAGCPRPAPAAHGREWQGIMRILGLSPSRTLDDPPEVPKARRTRRYRYACEKCAAGYYVGGAKHKKATAGTRFLCPACLKRGQVHRVAFTGEDALM